MTGPVLADIIDHSAIEQGEHPAWLAKDCPHCQRITKLCKAFREFGYTDLGIREQREAYHVAMIRKPGAEDGIIAMLTRSQLVEAGLVTDEP